MSVSNKLIAEMKRMPGEVDAWSLSVEKRSAVLHEIANIARDDHGMIRDRLSPRWFIPGGKPVSQVGQSKKEQRIYSALADQFLSKSYVVSVDNVVLALVPLLAVKRKSWRGWRPGWPQCGYPELVKVATVQIVVDLVNGSDWPIWSWDVD